MQHGSLIAPVGISYFLPVVHVYEFRTSKAWKIVLLYETHQSVTPFLKTKTNISSSGVNKTSFPHGLLIREIRFFALHVWNEIFRLLLWRAGGINLNSVLVLDISLCCLHESKYFSFLRVSFHKWTEKKRKALLH